MSLKVSGLSFGYKEKLILNNINFEVKKGELLSLLGPNGTGKTTLLKCINRINVPQKGIVTIDEKNIDELSPKELSHHLSYVPQSTHSMFPISVIDTVLMGRLPFIKFKVSSKDKEIVFNILERLNLNKLAFKSINQLSGGERQRVLIARAIAQEPQILLLDEPTSSLDMKNQLETLSLIKEIIKEKKLIAIMSIHDLNLATMFSDEFLMLKDSSAFVYGSSSKVITKENIKAVYGVDTIVNNFEDNKHVFLLKPNK
ncbi:ABC transporter ATP-binding protein [uncultured Clostridium sp.]|uniref:ABC transporter ATP-binding protein n=1 Tax=uncultured Clostridium sp. TaxID=59620 RepID=UPI0028E20993|nr:ABC transporter ATP-binding protein [uncultured Clostridium sp.]